MKKFIPSIVAILAFATRGFAADQVMSEIIINSGTAPIVLSGSVKAGGLLTLNDQPAAGDVIVLGTSSYYFQTGTSGTITNQIFISGSLAGTLTNTVNAITKTGTTGFFLTGTAANALVTAAAGPGNGVTLTAVATGTAGNAVATTGTFTSPNDFFNATTLAGGAIVQTNNTVYNLPAGTGYFLMSSADVVCLSGSSVSAAPAVVLQSGTVLNISGTTTLTGTTAYTDTHISQLATPVIIGLSATTATPINLKVTGAGTSTFVTGRVLIKGTYLPNP